MTTSQFLPDAIHRRWYRRARPKRCNKFWFSIQFCHRSPGQLPGCCQFKLVEQQGLWFYVPCFTGPEGHAFEGRISRLSKPRDENSAGFRRMIASQFLVWPFIRTTTQSPDVQVSLHGLAWRHNCCPNNLVASQHLDFWGSKLTQLGPNRMYMMYRVGTKIGLIRNKKTNVTFAKELSYARLRTQGSQISSVIHYPFKLVHASRVVIGKAAGAVSHG